MTWKFLSRNDNKVADSKAKDKEVVYGVVANDDPVPTSIDRSTETEVHNPPTRQTATQ